MFIYIILGQGRKCGGACATVATPSAVPLIIRYLLLIQFMLPAFVVAKFHLGTILGSVKPKKFFSDFAPDQIDLHRKTNRNYPACPTKKSRLGKLGSFVGLSVEIN